MACITKRLQVQRICWQYEYSVVSSQSDMYIKHTSNNGQCYNIDTHTHSNEVGLIVTPHLTPPIMSVEPSDRLS